MWRQERSYHQLVLPLSQSHAQGKPKNLAHMTLQLYLRLSYAPLAPPKTTTVAPGVSSGIQM
jgi:hypothetical protein